MSPSAATMRPKAAQQQGIQAMLTQFQSEWDAVMLEVFTLKQQLNASQQELAQSLYQQDAACRVIARLSKENTELKSQIASGAVQVARSGSNGGSMDVDSSNTGVGASSGAVGYTLSAELVKKMTESVKELSTARASRQIPPTTATRDKVAAYAETSHLAPHKTGATVSLDISSKSSLLVSGGHDKSVVLIDGATSQKVAQLTGHKKPLVGAKIVSSSSSTASRIVSLASDSEMIIWDSASKGDAFALTSKISLTKETSSDASEMSFDVHPCASLAIVTHGASYTAVELDSQQTHTQSPKQTVSGILSVSIHPDGEIMALGCKDGNIQVHNVFSGEHMATFTGHSGAVSALTFSENGYMLASIAADATLRTWDLEQISQISCVHLGSTPSALAFDLSGRFLATSVAPASNSATHEIRVFLSKAADLIATFALSAKHDAKASPVAAIRFGPNASYIAFSQDRNVKFWSQ